MLLMCNKRTSVLLLMCNKSNDCNNHPSSMMAAVMYVAQSVGASLVVSVDGIQWGYVHQSYLSFYIFISFYFYLVFQVGVTSVQVRDNVWSPGCIETKYLQDETRPPPLHWQTINYPVCYTVTVVFVTSAEKKIVLHANRPVKFHVLHSNILLADFKLQLIPVTLSERTTCGMPWWWQRPFIFAAVIIKTYHTTGHWGGLFKSMELFATVWGVIQYRLDLDFEELTSLSLVCI